MYKFHKTFVFCLELDRESLGFIFIMAQPSNLEYTPYRVSVDMKGYGQSEKEPESYPYRHVAE